MEAPVIIDGSKLVSCFSSATITVSPCEILSFSLEELRAVIITGLSLIGRIYKYLEWDASQARLIYLYVVTRDRNRQTIFT